MAAKDITLVGAVFARLTVISEPFRDGSDRRWRVKCRCECGIEKIIQCKNVANGNTVSCGCIRKGLPCEKNRKHGHSGGAGRKPSPTYLSWVAARSRCNDVNDRDYQNYGARGIAVCDRWSNFENFLADMGERPAGKSIDRIDSNGNYEPGNCRWSTMVEQQNNRRRNILIEHDGSIKTATQIAREYGIKPNVFIARLKRGWSLQRATLESA